MNSNIIRGNVVIGGDLEFFAESVYDNTFESNRVEGGNMHLRGDYNGGVVRNQVRRNVIRGGELWMQMGLDPLGDNVIELNFVSGSPGDGIALMDGEGGDTIVRNNTSVDNVGCDLNDTTNGLATHHNSWSGNHFGTKCGAATG